MANKPTPYQEFGELLTEGIKRLAYRKQLGAVQADLAEKLGYSANMIFVWRRGEYLPEVSIIATLAQIFVNEWQADQRWIEKFLEKGKYGSSEHIKGLVADLYGKQTISNKTDPITTKLDLSEPSQTGQYHTGNVSEKADEMTDLLAQIVSNTSWLPRKSYRALVGRDSLMREILDALYDTSGRWMIGIDGLGGIGKTALALEVAHWCLKEKSFDVVVWSKAPSKSLTSRAGEPGEMMTFQTVLNAIGLQLGVPHIAKLVGKEKEVRVQALLRNQRVLVVLDNLETAIEPQYEIVHRLQPLLPPSKALLTSRHRFKGDIYSINLVGLFKESAKDFIRQAAFEKNINQAATLKDDDLEQIIQSTGGSPLAMNLVVGQLNHLPLEVVVDQLKNIRLPENKTDEDDYFHFYKFIFSTSAQLLSDHGERLLYWMAHFPSGIGGTLEAIQSSPTLNLTNEALYRGVDELWKLSFLEVTKEANLGQRRYYLHALT